MGIPYYLFNRAHRNGNVFYKPSFTEVLIDYQGLLRASPQNFLSPSPLVICVPLVTFQQGSVFVGIG